MEEKWSLEVDSGSREERVKAELCVQIADLRYPQSPHFLIECCKIFWKFGFYGWFREVGLF